MKNFFKGYLIDFYVCVYNNSHSDLLSLYKYHKNGKLISNVIMLYCLQIV